MYDVNLTSDHVLLM